ncbi:MAG: ABC transporter ATP-binding protein [Bacteroidales bacterium]|nr:ABC transporter ATP-binding protein [Bacteroidales bacterium]
MGQRLFALTDVWAGYGDRLVLRGVSLDINADDFIGIVGPNGGGKTTLLRLLIGELKPLAGRVDRSCLNVGYLPQVQQIDRAFPITVLDVVLSGLMGRQGLWRRYGKVQREAAMECLRQAGVEALHGRSVGELSGGQLQRVLLCRALVSQPELLILDEPNTYVDNKFEGELYELLRQLNQRMAIVMVSHDLGTIASYVKSIACVNGTLHHHRSSHITAAQLRSYGCPIQLIAHGEVPHTVLQHHGGCGKGCAND